MLTLLGLTEQARNTRFTMSYDSDLEEQQISTGQLPENGDHQPSKTSSAVENQTQPGVCERAKRPKNQRKRMKKFLLKFFCGTRAELIPEPIDIEEKRKPITAEQIEEFINSRRYHKASKALIVLEHEAYGNMNNKNKEEIAKEQGKVNSLVASLGIEVSEKISKSIELLSHHDGNESDLISGISEAVKAVAEQVNEDVKHESEPRLQSRPKNWKRKWENVVKQSVYQRMTTVPETAGDQNSSSFFRQLEHMGKTMKSDLMVVVNVLKALYPEDFDVCNVYARHYHEYFSSQLDMITEYGLGERDTRRLLVWVHCIYPKEIVHHPDLLNNVTWENLSCLLVAERISELESQYISHVEALVEGWMNKSLNMEVKFWADEKEPAILNNFFHSELHIDIIQGLNGEIEGAKTLSLELGNQLLPSLVEKLAGFLRSYKKKFEEFKDGNRNHKHFQAVLIANINSWDDYRQYMASLEGHHLAEELKINVCTILGELERMGSDLLLQDLFLKLQPNFKTLSQKNGLCSHGTMQEIIKITKSHISKLNNLKPCYYQEIIESIHLHLVKEYIMRLMKKKVREKVPDQQKIIANQITENALLIKDCCKTHGSRAHWLNGAIPMLAEVIKLQDIDAIKLIVASLADQYPDISKNHIAAILYIKANLKSSEVKSIQSILDIRETLEVDSQKLFSQITVY